MKYLEKYENWMDSIKIIELDPFNILNILNEEKEDLIKCPCGVPKGWDKDKNQAVVKPYKYCCLEVDEEYIEDKIDNFYNNDDNYLKDNIKVTIKVTKHWLERLYRKSDSKYINKETIYNPTIDEGLDLIFKKIDDIFEFIKRMNKTDKKSVYLELIYENAVHNGKKVPYSEIISIEPKKGKQYEITLITQIKGEKLYTGKYNAKRMKVSDLEYAINEIFSILNK
jgi:hypothetical protein